jgi:hypothetical protein
MILLLAFGTVSFAQGQRYKSKNAWSFGVMADTQWTSGNDPAGNNPEYVSAAVIEQINQEFIKKGVKFVVQVGDLTDRAGDAGMAERATAAQPLFDAGIGFFPLRGNHETYGPLYGRDPGGNLNVPAFKSSFPQTQGLEPNLFGATNFSWPSSTNDILKGLSYAFDYNNASFVVVDVEQTANKMQDAPSDTNVTPAQTTCNTAITTGYKDKSGITYGGAPAGTTCGQGYFYILSSLSNFEEGHIYKTGFTVWQAAVDIPVGITTVYDSAGNAGATIVVTIHAGEWFRIDSSKRPSTNFYGWDIQNPDQTYNGQPFDIYDPISDPINRMLISSSSANTEFWPGVQQTWLSGRLDKESRGARGINHAFVFSHRPTIGANHVDGFFGADPSITPDHQNAFFKSLADNNVKYMISGHDHLYNRALVKSPNHESQIEQIISISGSTKFYTPASSDKFPAGVKDERETQIAQETNTMGYYIYTVDGDRVNVDYYSSIFVGGITGFSDAYPFGEEYSDLYPLWVTPTLYFDKKESFGYGQNGQQFVIPQGESYTDVKDSFEGTTAEILDGFNGSTSTDYTPGGPRQLVKAVNTGWAPKPAGDKTILSNILSLWGMGELNMDRTDVFVLEMSYVDRRVKGNGKANGNAGYRLSSLDKNGHWVNAVDLNVGVENAKDKKFIKGPWKPGYKLGTYGIDMDKGTVWAVINYNADFAATQ